MLALLLVLPAQHASADFIVDVYDNLGSFGDVADAIVAMQATTASNSGSFSVINFSDGGDLGNFGGDSAFPGNPSDFFGVHVTGIINIFEGFNYFGINHDDGALLSILGGLTLINSPSPTPPINSFGSVSCGGCGAGYAVDVDLWLYENAGVASLEFFHSDASNGVGALVTTVPEPGTLALFGIGLLGMGLARRKKA